MKRIINGTRYDTERATLIGEATASEYCNDFRWWSEQLYVTPRSKKYFLSGEGNAMSRWGERMSGLGEMYGSGSGILPLTALDARTWAERYLETEIVEQFFVDSIEDA